MPRLTKSILVLMIGAMLGFIIGNVLRDVKAAQAHRDASEIYPEPAGSEYVK